MSKRVQITYTEHFTISEADIRARINKQYEKENAEYEYEEGELEALQEDDFKQAILFKNQQLAKEDGQRFTYSYNGKTIVYQREVHAVPGGEWIGITPEGVMQHYYINQNGEVGFSEMPLHHVVDSSWSLEFKTEVHSSITKNILGYDCYFLVIEMEKRNEEMKIHDRIRYELFVTDELDLPAWSVLFLQKSVIKLCALEIKRINLDSPNSYSLQTAIEVNEEIDESIFTVPERYRKLP